jgi:uncharacterized membrane protein (UPF0127 family)
MKVGLREWASLGAKSVPGQLYRVVNVTRGTDLATSVAVAATSGARRRGLLGRLSLSAGEGLWIIPCESIHTWFMRFPIDLVYLNRDNQIEKLRSNVVPWRLSVCFSAGSVLELTAGSIRASRSERGDLLDFSSVSLVGDTIDYPTKS